MKVWIQGAAALSLLLGLAGCALFGPLPPPKAEDRIDLVVDQLQRLGKDYLQLGGKCEFGACTPPVQVNRAPGEPLPLAVGVTLMCTRVPEGCCAFQCRNLPDSTPAHRQCMAACIGPAASAPSR